MAEQIDSTPPAGGETPPAAKAPAVDVQEIVSKALSEQQAAQEANLRKELKEIVGFDSLKEFKDHQLAEQGKTQELLDSKSTELAAVTKRFQDSQINAALLTASSDAIDPATVSDLLASKCQCDENGNVSVNGKSPADAVKALLEQKPFLAKPQGETGSGSPQQTKAKNSMTRSEFDALDISAKAEFSRSGGAVV